MDPPAANPARREQLIALLILAAGLRRQGAGLAALRDALQDRLALLPQPALNQDDLDTLSTSLAGLPPHLTLRAVNGLLAGQQAAEHIPPPIPVHTAANFVSDPRAAVEWLVEPWAASGALTALTGRPKIGKTTFLLDLVAAALAGVPFLGRITSRTPVVYLTEQPPSSFHASLARSGLLGNDDLSLIFWNEAMALGWPQLVAVAASQCRSLGARLLVVDTLSQWVGLRGDMENQAGDAFASLQPLQRLAATGVAVVFAQHERKTGVGGIAAGRGSSAFAGAVDILVSFRRPPGDARQERRLLLALSRFDAVPPQLYVERADGRYCLAGDKAGAVVRDARLAILDALTHPPESTGAGPADSPVMPDLDGLLRLTGLKKGVAARALQELLAAGDLHREGTGRRSAPYRYSPAV